MLQVPKDALIRVALIIRKYFRCSTLTQFLRCLAIFEVSFGGVVRDVAGAAVALLVTTLAIMQLQLTEPCVPMYTVLYF